MITLIQKNQQLFALGIFILLVMVLLWVLQYAVIRYGQAVLNQLLESWTALRQYLSQSKRLIRLRNNYPKLYDALSQRLDIQHFYGLPLTGLLLVIVSILCWIIRQRYILVGLLIATLGSTIFTFLSKLLFHRTRPVDILLFEQTDSFPSGHATITVALYGFLAYMAICFSRNFATQVRIAAITIFFSLLIGLSRILLNEHYLSDVLGGYLVGALWLMVAISMTEWLRARNKIDWQIVWSVTHFRLVWLSVICVLIGTSIYAEFYQFPLLL